eukprot:gnl/TRDRNA2_/TRDRNA2_177186_c4_seq1.p1 gnl/TRDRNA2_/TRDRNA2_177186_c4~~gnl/TRDRNA2_/TRDRNA2_177186_c4_seq1.p1  ORF type:complete len:305 (+),score=26.19 gnl/TRDRNA2_/TRDRNA2_177186_c4_seq1:106-915(+)
MALLGQPGQAKRVLPCGASLHVTSFSGSRVRELLGLDSKTQSVPESCASQACDLVHDVPENGARFLLHELLPEQASHAVYLDADTLVLGDLAQLPAALRRTGRAAAFVRRRPTRRQRLHQEVLRNSLWQAPWASGLLDREAYNAGVFVLDLERWRDQGFPRALRWQALHWASGGLWRMPFSSQAPLLFAFANWSATEIATLPAAWNFDGLGSAFASAADDAPLLEQQKVLHWNGPKKPWLPDGSHRDVWLAYRRLANDLLLHRSVGGHS